jgi:hypothetical protein
VGSYRVIVDLIGATTTRTGLSVRCELDPNRYPKGVTVSDAEMAGLNITRDEFHGEWNYTLSPRPLDRTSCLRLAQVIELARIPVV